MTPNVRILTLIGVLFLATACQTQSPPPTASSPETCSVSLLERGPAGWGPYGLGRAGPIWFSAFGRVAPGHPAILLPGGGSYDGWKVLIFPDANSSGSVVLTGVDCASGKPIRFCYGACEFEKRVQMSVEQLEIDTGRHLDLTGSMVFWGPGLVRLTVARAGANLGGTVIEVPDVSP
ncbi:MAG: hypothetical protein ACREMY_25675 [bacterium]